MRKIIFTIAILFFSLSGMDKLSQLSKDELERADDYVRAEKTKKTTSCVLCAVAATACTASGVLYWRDGNRKKATAFGSAAILCSGILAKKLLDRSQWCELHKQIHLELAYKQPQSKL